MNKHKDKLLFAGASFYLASSLIPALKIKAWWIRVWDFPRLQMGVAGAVLFEIWRRALTGQKWQKKSALGMIAVGLSLDAYRIFPYTALSRVESLPAKKNDKKNQLSLLTCNVLQTNPERQPLRDRIRELAPDLIFLLEVDSGWTDDFAYLQEDYPYILLNPLSNTYGLAFYSRLPFEESKINFLIQDDIPSIEVTLVLPSRQKIKLFGLHPTPPRPQDGPSTERDAELIQIAKMSKKTDLPVVVIGDLNDVAWSHTTRHFRRLSGLLDPRIGRGPVPTFPVHPPFFRFPIDHIFHSESLRIMEMKRLEQVGSDHFPLFARLSYEPERKENQRIPEKHEGDVEEAKETLQKVEAET